MSERLPITEWIEKWDLGHFNSDDLDTQCDAGWYDWFCKNSSLLPRLRKLAPKVKKVAVLMSDDFKSKHYVWFKNNCPLRGKLYDDFRISNIETNDVIYTITPAEGYDNSYGQASLWGVDNKFDKPLVQGTWQDIMRWFEQKGL